MPFRSFDIPTIAECDYLIAFDIACIYVAIGNANFGDCVIGIAHNPLKALSRIRSEGFFGELGFLIWAHSKREAQAVLGRVYANAAPFIKKNQCNMPLRQLNAEINRAASEIGVTLTSHEDVMLRVRVNVAKVDEVIQKAKQNGEMKWFNGYFREYSQDRRRANQPVMSYEQAIGKLRQSLFRSGQNGGFDRKMLLKTVFG